MCENTVSVVQMRCMVIMLTRPSITTFNQSILSNDSLNSKLYLPTGLQPVTNGQLFVSVVIANASSYTYLVFGIKGFT